MYSQKVYFYLRQITEAANDVFPICANISFNHLYLDRWEDFIQANTTHHKDCLSSIYEMTTVLLRGLTNFTEEYGHRDDIYFYYRSESFRDNYRVCIKEYANKADHRKLLDTYDLLQCSCKITVLDAFQNVDHKSFDCEESVAEWLGNTKIMNLTDWAHVITDDEIEAYGQGHLCVLNKFYTIDETYDMDGDAFYEYYDFGDLRLSYKECWLNSEKYDEVLHQRMVNKTFDYIFFGHFRKCFHARMAEVATEDTFLQIEDDWRYHIDEALDSLKEYLKK